MSFKIKLAKHIADLEDILDKIERDISDNEFSELLLSTTESGRYLNDCYDSIDNLRNEIINEEDFKGCM